ncbi:MAG: hypothetical protein V3S69_05485 [Dehalococcoidales bacterium]
MTKVTQKGNETIIEITRWDFFKMWLGHHIGCRLGIERLMPYDCSYCYAEACKWLQGNKHE